MTNKVPTDVDTSIDSESLTRAFSALADARRRDVLRYLEQHRSMTLPTLADEVAESEADVSLPHIDETTVKEVYLSLYHCEVPKLEAADLIEYDQERDLVIRRDSPESDLAMSLLDVVSAASNGE